MCWYAHFNREFNLKEDQILYILAGLGLNMKCHCINHFVSRNILNVWYGCFTSCSWESNWTLSVNIKCNQPITNLLFQNKLKKFNHGNYDDNTKGREWSVCIGGRMGMEVPSLNVDYLGNLVILSKKNVTIGLIQVS